jgi:hypothetical protein
LTIAAMRAADHRAANRIAGHADDFSFLPAGTSADAAGCARWEQGWGFGSCCLYESYTYAGAAWTIGADSKVYCHLFVAGGGRSQIEPVGYPSGHNRRIFRRAR